MEFIVIPSPTFWCLSQLSGWFCICSSVKFSMWRQQPSSACSSTQHSFIPAPTQTLPRHHVKMLLSSYIIFKIACSPLVKSFSAIITSPGHIKRIRFTDTNCIPCLICNIETPPRGGHVAGFAGNFKACNVVAWLGRSLPKALQISWEQRWETPINIACQDSALRTALAHIFLLWHLWFFQWHLIPANSCI